MFADVGSVVLTQRSVWQSQERRARQESIRDPSVQLVSLEESSSVKILVLLLVRDSRLSCPQLQSFLP